MIDKDNMIDYMISYENDKLDKNEVIELFQLLLDTGIGFKLQGHYAITTKALLDSSYIFRKVNHDNNIEG